LKNLNRTNKQHLSSIDRWMNPFFYPFPKLEIKCIWKFQYYHFFVEKVECILKGFFGKNKQKSLCFEENMLTFTIFRKRSSCRLLKLGRILKDLIVLTNLWPNLIQSFLGWLSVHLFKNFKLTNKLSNYNDFMSL